jgi:coproporphyrinogen III oxidase
MPAAEKGETSGFRRRCVGVVDDVQQRIVGVLEALDGSRFRVDRWQRAGGGGGSTCVLENGGVFEKAGVNVSEVFGELGEDFAAQLPGEGRAFFAAGVSLVLHPLSPMVPAVHANFRYIEKGERRWFGGGSDLTPCYLEEEDARHFHAVWKRVCDRHDPSYYPRFKKWCDEYFFLPHRGECRGVGGIFFDYLEGDFERLFAFWADAARSFLDAYVPIVERRRGAPYGERERQFQLARRSRYVEFNLMYDRGTIFGLRTKGRTESILMSLPPLARFVYDHRVEPGSREEALLQVLARPRDWLSD